MDKNLCNHFDNLRNQRALMIFSELSFFPLFSTVKEISGLLLRLGFLFSHRYLGI